MRCKNCKSKKLKKIIFLGKQPISSHFYSNKKINLRQYSLDLYKCLNCKLIQFKSLPKLDDMYGLNYGYRTSLSPLMINHMKKKYLKLKKIAKSKSNILDIGCNDGTFLNFFSKHKNIELYGIDPSAAKFRKYHNKKNHLIIDYFSKKKINDKFKNIKFDLITSFAMFYDIEDPNSFCKDINSLLDEKGVWIVEFSYFPLLLKNLTYDQINHEHVTYYTLTTFNKILKKNNLKILDVNFNEINGGSAEVIVVKKQSKKKINKNKIFKIFEQEALINDLSYKKFNLRLQNVKKVINNFLDKKREKIIGYGASTKGNIILNHCKISNKHLKFIADGNSQKWGRYTPESNIRIISKTKMRRLKPRYLFVLIWSFRSEVIMQEKKFILSGGKLIFPLPIFHIIDRDNYKYYLNEKLSAFGFDI